MHRLHASAALLLAIVASACAPDEVDSLDPDLETMRAAAPPIFASGAPIPAAGAFSCDFALDFTQLVEPVGAEIERDRILSQRFVDELTWPNDPGMLHKHIPILQTSPTTAWAGGRYLFEGRLQAAAYEQWITALYEYPGDTQFLDRPEFSDPECRDWTVLRAWRLAALEDHTALRTERFDTGRTNLGQELALAFQLLIDAPGLVALAEARGYAEVHLLHNLADHKVQIVYFVNRMSGPSAELPDVVALGTIAGAPPLGDDIADAHALTRVFDRPSLVLTAWLPYDDGDGGDEALWPNSPPLPAPFCGDGVCVPSRGEVVSCAADCPATCGDTACQPGESVVACPTDCPLPL
jgi:hypothetical protein